MGGERASLMITDPPYLVGYTGRNHPQTWGNGGKQAGHDVASKSWDAYREHDEAVAFYRDFLKVALEYALLPDVAIYQCHAILRSEFIWQAWREAGLAAPSGLYLEEEPGGAHTLLVSLGFRAADGRLARGPSAKRRPPADARAVWEIDSAIEDGAAGIHPTQKPVELFRRPIEWHTKPGEVIFEPFSGSGTAIIAAEMTGRRCYAIELSPAFVDVAVTRWERFTGRKAVRHD